jgi:hypothetical protein
VELLPAIMLASPLALILGLVIFPYRRKRLLRPRARRLALLLALPPALALAFGEVFQWTGPGEFRPDAAWVEDSIWALWLFGLGVGLGYVTYARGMRISAALLALSSMAATTITVFAADMAVTGAWI